MLNFCVGAPVDFFLSLVYLASLTLAFVITSVINLDSRRNVIGAKFCHKMRCCLN